MSRPDRQPAALSPVLLLGFALRPAPPALLQPFASLALGAMLRRHRSVLERLECLDNPVFLIDPADLPFRLLLDFDLPAPRLRVLAGDDECGEQAATIRGSFLALVDLLEGRLDGDALFFSRALSVEGDMEAVVALRNAVDGAEISLIDDLLAPLGPLAGPGRRLAKIGGMLFRRAERDLEVLRAAIVGPLARRCDAQESALRELDETVAGLSRKRGKRS